MRIIVTGCCGFIGSHVSEELLKQGHQVLGIDNMNDYYDISRKINNMNRLKKYINFFMEVIDVNKTDYFLRWKPDVIFHLASRAGVRHSLAYPTQYIDDNVRTMVHILDCLKKWNKNTEIYGSKLPKFIYASSSSVYGSNKKVPFNENDSLDNIESPYALSKKVSEEYATLYYKLYGIKSIGLRFFTVYGPNGRPDMAPEKFLKCIYDEKPLPKYGTGESQRDYTYVGDIVHGLINSIYADVDCDVFNLGNNEVISLNDFILLCEKIVGKKAIINQMDNQKGDVPITYADIEKSKKILKYNPITNLENGLTKTFEWIKNNL